MAYGAFAQVYDDFTKNVHYKKRAEYICSLLSSCGKEKKEGKDFKAGLEEIKGKSLLDLACGTGSLTLEFCRLGFDVIGLDNSPDMLSMAQNKLAENSCQALLLCQDMTSFELYGTVDFVVCSLDSLNHITNKDDLALVFERVALFLNPGGLFVFDMNTFHKHKNILADNAFIYENEGVFLAWQNSYRGKGRVDIDLDIFIKSGNSYKRYEEGFSEQAYEDKFIIKALENAGLELISSYDELTYNPPHEKSERLFYVAKNKL